MEAKAVALDAQGGASPVDAETIDRLEYGAPVLFMQLGAIEDKGDGDTLTRLYRLWAGTPGRSEAAATEYPRSTIWRTAASLNSRLNS